MQRHIKNNDIPAPSPAVGGENKASYTLGERLPRALIGARLVFFLV
jgi:hypothetical protein